MLPLQIQNSTYRFNLKGFHQGSNITFQLNTMRRPFIKSYSTSDKFQFELFRENLVTKAVHLARSYQTESCDNLKVKK